MGPHVVRELVDAGAEVTVVHRGKTEADLPDRVRHVHGGFGELDRLLPGLLAADPKVVVDMVPWIAKSGSQGVLHFHGVERRGLVVTSADVYRAFGGLSRSKPGPPDEWPLNEESPLRARPAPDRAPDIDFDNVETEDAVCCDPGYPVTVLRLPDALRFDLDVAQQYVVDSARIRREIGYAERVSEGEGLRRTIEWERAHPPEGYSADYAEEDRVLAYLGRRR